MPVALKSADELVFRRFKGEGLDFFKFRFHESLVDVEFFTKLAMSGLSSALLCARVARGGTAARHVRVKLLAVE